MTGRTLRGDKVRIPYHVDACMNGVMLMYYVRKMVARILHSSCIAPLIAMFVPPPPLSLQTHKRKNPTIVWF